MEEGPAPTAAGTLHMWRSCLGACLICGAPLGMEAGRHVARDAAGGDEGLAREGLADVLLAPDAAAGPAEDAAPATESDVRVAMFRYGLLRPMQRLHVLDRYTALAPRPPSGAPPPYLAVLRKHEALLRRVVGPQFADDITRPAFPDAPCEYDHAALLSARLVLKRTVPGCADCNAAMNRAVLHADVAYRCSPLTRDAVLPEIDASRDARTLARVDGGAAPPLRAGQANEVKKWLMQTSFFFAPPQQPPEGARWRAKSDAEVTADASLLRCVAALVLWGRQGAARMRAIAVFYGAWYVFHTQAIAEAGFTFERWHLHAFRDLYMQRHPGPGTFFGMTQAQAAALYEPSREAPVATWLPLTRERLEAFAAHAAARTLAAPALGRIERFWDTVQARVVNEQTLLHLACEHGGRAKEGLDTLFAFLLYNARDPMCPALLRRVRAFLAEAARAVRRERPRLLGDAARARGRAPAQPQ